MEDRISIDGDYGEIIGIKETKEGSSSIALLIHGFGATKNNKSITHMRKFFDGLGISTFRMDMYNHGESSGDFEDMTVTKCISSIKNTIKYLIDEGHKDIIIFATSMGGLAAFMSSLDFQDNISHLLLRSPVSEYQGEVIVNYHKIPIKEWKESGIYEWKNKLGVVTKLKYDFYEDAETYSSIKCASQNKISTVIVHGDVDDFVPLEGSKRLEKEMKNCKLCIVKKADHFFTSEQMDEACRYYRDAIL